MKTLKKIAWMLIVVMIFSSFSTLIAGAITVDGKDIGTVFFEEKFDASGLDEKIAQIPNNTWPSGNNKAADYTSGAALFVSGSTNAPSGTRTIRVENGMLVLDATTVPTTDTNGSFITYTMPASSSECFVVEMEAVLEQSEVISALDKPYIYLLRSRISNDGTTKWGEYLSVHASTGKLLAAGKETTGQIEWNKKYTFSIVFHTVENGRTFDVYLDGVQVAAGISAPQGMYFNDDMQWRIGYGNAGAKVSFDMITAYALQGSGEAPAHTGYVALTGINETFEGNQTLESGLTLTAASNGHVTENGNTYFRFVNAEGSEGRITLASAAATGFEASMDIKFEKDADGKILYPQSKNANGEAMWVFGFKSTVNGSGKFASFVSINNTGELLTDNGKHATGMIVGADGFTNVKIRWIEENKSYTVYVNQIPVASGSFPTTFTTASFDLRLMNPLKDKTTNAIAAVAVNVDNIVFRSLSQSADIQTVGAQLSGGTKVIEGGAETQAIRFVAGVHSLDYRKVGFAVTEKNHKAYWNINGSTVYESILASDATGVTETVAASEYGCSHLFAFTIYDVPLEEMVFTVEPYAIYDDGTVYYGATMIVTVTATREIRVTYQ